MLAHVAAFTCIKNEAHISTAQWGSLSFKPYTGPTTCLLRIQDRCALIRNAVSRVAAMHLHYAHLLCSIAWLTNAQGWHTPDRNCAC